MLTLIPLSPEMYLCVIASVPVSELIGVEEGQVEILPRKSFEDTDKDFTGMLEAS